MPTEPAGSLRFRLAKPERASAVALTRKIALLKNVHSEQYIELKGLLQFEAFDILEDERKCPRPIGQP